MIFLRCGKTIAGMTAALIRYYFVDTKKEVRMEVGNAKAGQSLLLGLHFFMRFVLGRAVYEKENLNKLG